MKPGDCIEVHFKTLTGGIYISDVWTVAIVQRIEGNKILVDAFRDTFPNGEPSMTLPLDQKGHLWR